MNLLKNTSDFCQIILTNSPLLYLLIPVFHETNPHFFHFYRPFRRPAPVFTTRKQRLVDA